MPLEDRIEVLSAEELEELEGIEGIELLHATPENLEALDLSEEEVSEMQASFDDLVAEDAVAQAPICFCLNGCRTCCQFTGGCVTMCGQNCG